MACAAALLLLQVLSLAVLRNCSSAYLALVTRVVGGLQREALRETSIDLVDEVSGRPLTDISTHEQEREESTGTCAMERLCKLWCLSVCQSVCVGADRSGEHGHDAARPPGRGQPPSHRGTSRCAAHDPHRELSELQLSKQVRHFLLYVTFHFHIATLSPTQLHSPVCFYVDVMLMLFADAWEA